MPTLALDNIEDELLLDPGLFRPRADFLLRVHGQSMLEADIHDRDILAVHRTAQVSNGQIVVARLGDEATVKILPPQWPPVAARAGQRCIHSHLKSTCGGKHCSIEGLVVGLVRRGLPQARKS